MRTLILLPLLLALWHCKPQEKLSTQYYNPSSEQVRITGRVKHLTDSVEIYWPGTSVMVRFKGTALSAILQDEQGKNYFNVVIDGDSVRHFRVGNDKQSYVLASGLQEGEHTIELIKRTEWELGKTWFYGVETEGTLLDLPPPNKRTIEFFGNSITAGYAIDDDTGGDSPDSIYTNNYYTYAALTARHFKADYYATVRSGIGIMVSWFPLIMPEMYNRLDPTDSTSRWDFSLVQPDVVVINLMQNDSWLVNMPDHPSFNSRFGETAPDEDDIINAYRSFVESVRGHYPEAHIICAIGSMDATRQGSVWPEYVKQAVDALSDDKIYTIVFPFIEKEGHPRRDDNAKMASQLIQFIEENIQW